MAAHEVVLWRRPDVRKRAGEVDVRLPGGALLFTQKRLGAPLEPVAKAAPAQIHTPEPKEQQMMQSNVTEVTKRSPIATAVVALAKRDRLSVKAAAWRTIEGLGAELRKATPTLTKEQAVTKAMDTPAGIEAMRLYRDPRAHLPVEKYEAPPEPKAGTVLTDLAKAYRDRDGVDFVTALRRAESKFPAVAKMAREQWRCDLPACTACHQ